MEKKFFVGKQEVRMRASALIPRTYRFKFGRDLVRDMMTLQKSYQKAMELQAKGDISSEEANLSALDLTIFENVAWCMAKSADASIPDSPDEWLETFEGVFSIYEILPHVLELWGINNAQTSQTRKK